LNLSREPRRSNDIRQLLLLGFVERSPVEVLRVQRTPGPTPHRS